MAKKNHGLDFDIEVLIRWYRKNKRDLPWRIKPDPYSVWLAEIMSQQTQMAALLPYYHKFKKRFPTLLSLGHAKETDILALWTGLGYYSRARNLHKTAQILCAKNASFPKTAKELEELPGIGPYTAAAISSQAFGEHVSVWDGNVLRVTARLLGIKKAHTLTFKQHALHVLNAAIKNHNASEFNQAFMEFGALLCSPKRPQCSLCPLQQNCIAFKKNEVQNTPEPKTKKQQEILKPKIYVLCKKARTKTSFFIRKRPEQNWFGGMWEFPSELGGVKKPIEKLGLTSNGAIHLKTPVKHHITHHKILAEVLVFKHIKHPPKKMSGTWKTAEDILSEHSSFPISTMTRKTLKSVMKFLADLQD